MLDPSLLPIHHWLLGGQLTSGRYRTSAADVGAGSAVGASRACAHACHLHMLQGVAQPVVVPVTRASLERPTWNDPRARAFLSWRCTHCASRANFPYCTHLQIFHRLFHCKLGPHLTLPTSIVSHPTVLGQHAPSADFPASSIEPAVKTNRSVYLALLILFSSVKERAIWDLPKSMVSESLVRGILSIIHRC